MVPYLFKERIFFTFLRFSNLLHIFNLDKILTLSTKREAIKQTRLRIINVKNYNLQVLKDFSIF